MAQFDVYKNTNRSTRKQYPLLVDVQHSVLSMLATRIVIPLINKDSVHGAIMDVLMPEVLRAGRVTVNKSGSHPEHFGHAFRERSTRFR